LAGTKREGRPMLPEGGETLGDGVPSCRSHGVVVENPLSCSAGRPSIRSRLEK